MASVILRYGEVVVMHYRYGLMIGAGRDYPLPNWIILPVRIVLWIMLAMAAVILGIIAVIAAMVMLPAP